MNVGIDIGGPSSQRPWDSRLDELAIWTTALSDETVLAIYDTTINNPGKVADLSETPEQRTCCLVQNGRLIMSTNYIAPIWRMPRNANKDKLSNYSIDFDGVHYINCVMMTFKC